MVHRALLQFVSFLAMEATQPVQSSPLETPSPSSWRFHCDSEVTARIEARIQSHTSTSRMVGHSPSRLSIRDWLQGSLAVSVGRIVELSLLRRGVFVVRLSDELAARSLLARQPIIAGSRFLFLLPWFSGFSLDEFDRRHIIPRFPLTLFFPALPLEFRDILPDIVRHWGAVVPGSLVTSSGTPRIQVIAPLSTAFPDLVEIAYRETIYPQQMIVSGRPNQCLRCHQLGHLVRDCPRQPLPLQPAPPPRETALGSDATPPPQRPQAASSWQEVPRRHTFRPGPWTMAGGHPRPPGPVESKASSELVVPSATTPPQDLELPTVQLPPPPPRRQSPVRRQSPGQQLHPPLLLPSGGQES